MKQILSAKLDCVWEYRQLLLASKGAIVNATPNEKYWSSGVSKADIYSQKSWTGLNHLGRLHMMIRDELQSLQAMIVSQKRRISDCVRRDDFIDEIILDTTNVLVTVYAKNDHVAHVLTDEFAIPRKIVRVIVKS